MKRPNQARQLSRRAVLKGAAATMVATAAVAIRPVGAAKPDNFDAALWLKRAKDANIAVCLSYNPADPELMGLWISSPPDGRLLEAVQDIERELYKNRESVIRYLYRMAARKVPWLARGGPS